MGLRPARCYRESSDRAYTRFAARVNSKNFIGGIPGLKIRQFNMGNMSKPYTHCVSLVAEETQQIRDNAIESLRTCVNKILTGTIGKENYWARILVYPHQVLRENKVAQGNKADRISDGMSHCFGTPVGRAARVKPGTELMCVFVEEANIAATKTAFLKSQKLGIETSIALRETTEEEREMMKKIKRKIKEVEEIKPEEKKEEAAEGEKKEGEKAAEKGPEKKGAEAKKTEEKKEAAPTAGKAEAKKEEPKKGKK